MAYQYSVFNPQKSVTALRLMNTPVSELMKKYVKKKDANSTKYFEGFKEEVNKVDGEGYLINPFLYIMEGANLNFAATQVFSCYRRLHKLGYEFKLDAVVRDYDILFSEFSNLITEMTTNSPIEKITKDIAYFFATEIIGNKIVNNLEMNNNSNYSL